MRNLFLTLFLSISSLSISSAQSTQGKEWNNWYFASGAITFNTTTPTVLDDSKMFSWDNSATISDFYGNLLFYTNGDTIWNRKHDVIGANSGRMRVHSSCWAGSIILKQPGNNNLYYVFQAPSQEQGMMGFDTIAIRYCVIDISRNNGLGAIISRDNLIVRFKFSDSGREKLGIIRHATKDAWWLVTTNDKYQFISFLFDKDGIDTNGVVSKDMYCYNGGYISFSPDNKLMGAPNGVYKFNNSTGKVEDLFGNLIQYPQHNAFSPNSRYFYYKSNGSESLFQVDLWQNVSSDKKLVENVIYHPSGRNAMCALMLAPDRKIYINSEDGKYLSVIDDPDKLSCNLLINQYELKNKNFKYREGFGLPIIPSSIKSDPVKYIRKCNSLFLFVDHKSVSDSVSWEVNDNMRLSVLKGDSVEYHLKYKTNYLVKCISFINGKTDTSYNFIPIDTVYDVSCSFTKIELCKESVTISARIDNADKYKWSSGDTLKRKIINSGGKYWVDSYIKGCIIRDSFEIISPAKIIISFPDTVSICSNQAIYLFAKGFQTYEWSNNIFDSVNLISAGGKYWLKVSNGCKDTVVHFFVREEKCDCEIFFPNAFTPNLDNINDDFGPETECKFKNYNLQIYNRWGEKLFETTDTKGKWSGKFKKSDVPEGCYIYIFRSQKVNGEWIYRNGFVNLLR